MILTVQLYQHSFTQTERSDNLMNKTNINRGAFYVLGLLLLALGIILNTKCGLGTVLAVIGVGRVIAVFNHLCWDTIARLTGFIKK